MTARGDLTATDDLPVDACDVTAEGDVNAAGRM